VTCPEDYRLQNEERWSWTLPFLLSSVAEARAQVATVLITQGVGADIVDDACSVVSELLGNALRHARPKADGHVVVTLGIDDTSLALAVEDGGGVTVPSLVSPPPLARNGRGLGIVHSLTRDWGIRERADGNTVFGILSRA
jgi:serine/threonine-protein kinase RsbW